MKKENVSLEQLEQRKTFNEELLAGGWVVDDSWNELLEGGADLEPESQAEYSSEFFQVRIGLHAQNAYLMLECESRNGSGGFGLYLFFGNNLRPVLREVISRVSFVSRENYLEMIKALTLLCDEVLLQSGGELVKVSPT
jgi:hypothetical protein